MDGLKMLRLFLVLTLAMTVASQPLEAIATSGGASLSTQLLNWAQVGFEAFLEWAKQGFGINTDDESTTSEHFFSISSSCWRFYLHLCIFSCSWFAIYQFCITLCFLAFSIYAFWHFMPLGINWFITVRHIFWNILNLFLLQYPVSWLWLDMERKAE